MGDFYRFTCSKLTRLIPSFVLEASKKLEENPADVSARTMLLMYQVMIGRATGNQSLDLDSTVPMDTPGFSPSSSTLWINALWYISLSLSIAASLVAMLAKEWCYTYLSSRNGQPWLQARRRQQRWDGIIQWKMQELLVLLPSLIHLALRELVE